jgi:hypothetical protein
VADLQYLRDLRPEWQNTRPCAQPWPGKWSCVAPGPGPDPPPYQNGGQWVVPVVWSPPVLWSLGQTARLLRTKHRLRCLCQLPLTRRRNGELGNVIGPSTSRYNVPILSAWKGVCSQTIRERLCWELCDDKQECDAAGRQRSQSQDRSRRIPTGEEPDDWVSGDDPMTGAQASYSNPSRKNAAIRTVSNRTTKAEASKRIDALKSKRRPVQHR